MVSDRAAHVALALAPGIGPVRFGLLLHHCGSASGALAAPVAFLASVPGLSKAAAGQVHSTDPDHGVRVLEAVERLGGRCLLAGDPEYPTALDPLPDRPPVLFALGLGSAVTRPAVAMVGSRDPTEYGVAVCRELAGGAAAQGLTVVSGMARGLDAVAHAAALDRGGLTIGVLGNGFGVVYPAANRGLYDRVASAGLLVTEHPPGERPHAGSFPRRNRIISGLARVTVVVEAGAGSGALITAGTALEQGREVMAVPGNITSPRSAGTNQLIRDGAAPLLALEDLFPHYPEVGRRPARVDPQALESAPPVFPVDLTEPERRVGHTLSEGPLAVELAIERARLTAGLGLAAISALELRGLVIQRGGILSLTSTCREPGGGPGWPETG